MKLFKLYANGYNALKLRLYNIGIELGLPKYVERLKMAEMAAMARNAEMIISNINKCEYFFELKACKDHYHVLCISYPDFRKEFGGIILTAIANRDLIIKQSFNK